MFQCCKDSLLAGCIYICNLLNRISLKPPTDAQRKPKKNTTHPTDSARGLVEFSDTNTWQANLWSAGCFVMKPKYLQRSFKKDIQYITLTPNND